MRNMSTLHDIYLAEGRGYLNSLAERIGRNPKYLWQIATGRRTPSVQVVRALVEADARLSFDAVCSGAHRFPPSRSP